MSTATCGISQRAEIGGTDGMMKIILFAPRLKVEKYIEKSLHMIGCVHFLIFQTQSYSATQ